MKIGFCKTDELKGSSYVKNPLRTNAISNIENTDKNRFIWSILAGLHHCENNLPNRVSNYKQYFNEPNIQGFDFTNGFISCVDHKFGKLNTLSINILDLNFYQYQNKWKHN